MKTQFDRDMMMLRARTYMMAKFMEFADRYFDLQEEEDYASENTTLLPPTGETAQIPTAEFTETETF